MIIDNSYHFFFLRFEFNIYHFVHSRHFILELKLLFVQLKLKMNGLWNILLYCSCQNEHVLRFSAVKCLMNTMPLLFHRVANSLYQSETQSLTTIFSNGIFSIHTPINWSVCGIIASAFQG